MARVTVEDCIDKVESPYELVLVAKERTTQLNSGVEPTVSADKDKNTVISLREIANENVKVPELIASAVHKLRKHVEQIDDVSSEDEEIGDDFENLYKGEISKSGTPILPSKRARKIPEKIQVFKEDLQELKGGDDSSLTLESDKSGDKTESKETLEEIEDKVSLESLKEEEAEQEQASQDKEATNT